MSSRAISEDRGILPTTNRPVKGHSSRRGVKGIPHAIVVVLREFGPDLLTTIIIGIIALCIDKYVPDFGGRARYFRLLPKDSTSPQMEAFGHPYRKQIISFWTSAGLDIGVPFVVILILELCTRGKFKNLARGMLGAFKSVVICCFFQIIVKTFAGGFRPSFFEICQPEPGNTQGAGWDGTWYKWTICTGDPEKVAWALESFPSGHVATSFAAGVYLSLWINAKLKVFGDYRSNSLTIILFLAPLILATLMGGAISADMSHHWYDILGGAILGTFVAFLCYRNSYVSIFHYRVNHIGLDSSKRFSRRPEYDYDEYHSRFGFPLFHSRKTG